MGSSSAWFTPSTSGLLYWRHWAGPCGAFCISVIAGSGRWLSLTLWSARPFITGSMATIWQVDGASSLEDYRIERKSLLFHQRNHKGVPETTKDFLYIFFRLRPHLEEDITEA